MNDTSDKTSTPCQHCGFTLGEHRAHGNNCPKELPRLGDAVEWLSTSYAPGLRCTCSDMGIPWHELDCPMYDPALADLVRALDNCEKILRCFFATPGTTEGRAAMTAMNQARTVLATVKKHSS